MQRALSIVLPALALVGAALLAWDIISNERGLRELAADDPEAGVLVGLVLHGGPGLVLGLPLLLGAGLAWLALYDAETRRLERGRIP